MKPLNTFKYTILVLLLINIPVFISAQYQDDYVDPLTRSLDKTNAKVGTLPGSLDINSIGAATYNIPIFISPGTSGMQPALSIIYNSHNGDGIIGQGWNLAGLSEIRRVPKNYYHDNQVDGVDLQNTDMFALDSNRLILTSGSQYGVDGSEYATELETFVKVIAHGTAGTGPSWFEVNTKDGRTIYYGNTSDSKVEATGSSTVYMWRMNKVIDQDGNTIKYIYNEVNGESYISRINYTTNDSAGLVTPYNSIKFEYATRTDVNSRYVGGSKIPATVLLTWIKVETENSAQVRKYQFKYFKDNYNISFLNEIKVYGSDDSYFNSTVIGWDTDTTDFRYADAFNNGLINRYYLGDFNGDGRTDFVSTEKRSSFYSLDKWELWLASENGESFTKKNEGYLDTGFKGFYVADVDGNGNDEILWKSVQTIPYQCNPHQCDSNEIDLRLNDTLELNDISFIGTFRPPPPIRDTCWDACYYTRVSFLNYSYDDSIGLERGSSDYDLVFDDVSADIYPVPADFDGNGKPDYMILLPDKSLNFVMIDGYDRSGMSFSNADDVRIIDFDGDGRKEVLVIKDNNSYIYQYNVDSDSFSEIYTSTTFPTKDYRIFPGDYNGDKKTDILSWKSGTGWSLKFSTGTGFETSANTPSLINIDPDASTADNNYFIADFNFDDKSDILEVYKYQSQSKQKVFYSRGDGIFNVEENDYPKSSIEQNYFKFGDFNGDGRKDLFFYDNTSDTNQVNICFYQKDVVKNKVSSIVNGSNYKTEINFKRLNGSTSFYTKNHDSSFPVYDYCGPYYAVSEVKTDNGLGNFIYTWYSWEGAKIHRQGKRFLGFKTEISSDTAHYIRSIKTFDFNLSYYYRYLEKDELLEVYDPYVNDTIKTTTLTDSVKYFGSKRIFSYNYRAIEQNKLLKTTIETTHNYDNYGNLLRSTAIFTNDEDGCGIEAVKSTTSEYDQYGNYGIPNKLIYQVDSSQYTGKPVYSREKEFTYDSSGKLLTETVDPGKSKAVTVTYSSFNDFGLPEQMTLSASGVASRTTSYVYDSKSRFLTETTNPLVLTNYKTYFPGTGNVHTETSIDGLCTTYEYDGFGQLIETVTPQANHILTSREWDNTGSGGAYSLYLITTDAEEIPYTKTYYDLLNRELKSEVEGYSGSVYQEKVYNSKGYLIRQSKPHLVSESTKWNYFDYDSFGRETKDSTAFIAYRFEYSDKTTTVIRRNSEYKSIKRNSLDNVTRIYWPENSIINYSYHSNGQVSSINSFGKGMTFYFNEYGLADSTWNTSSGSIAYGYNAFGELTSQTDANGNTYNFQFDKLGRIISKQGPEGTSTYNYISSGNGLGQLQSVTGPDGICKSFAYDTLSQVIQLKDSIPDEQEFITGFTYDSWGNNTSITYPSGIVINNYYSNGYLSEIKKSGDISIWELDDVNGSGNPLQFTLGSASLRTNFTYDIYGNIRYKQTGNMEQEFWYEPEDLGRLTGRGYKEYGSPSGLAEGFGYDDLDRLNFIGTYGRPNDTIRYDNVGNISYKSGIGDYSYKANSNSLETITNIVDTTFISNQSLTYTESNMTASISQEPYELQLVYGPDNQRIKTILKENNDTVRTKYFSSNYEKIISDSTTKEFNYIYSPYGLIAIIVKSDSSENMYYTETDHLGSIIGLINLNGTYAERYAYDAWGQRRNPDDWSYDSIPNHVLIDRGFTGHEHLDEFGLINMNGRIYDPYIGRFLSVDPVIQFPDNAQNFNGYAYCLNNPLKYSDPSGMRLEPLPNPADAGYPYNPEAAAWLANYYAQSFGGGGGGGVNTVTGFWDRNASTAGMLGFRYENGQYIDNATSNIVPFNVVYSNYVVPHSSESYSFEGNNIEWGYYAQVKGGPVVALTFVLSDGTRLKFDFGNELNGSIYVPPSNTPGRYTAADMTEQICAGALNFALGLFLGGVAEIGFLGASVNAAKGGLATRFVSTADGIVDVSPTLNRISSGVKLPFRNDGAIFKNLEGLLPNNPMGYYNEFVHPVPGMNGPGPMRIVTGKGSDIWFTPNHYRTFIRIR